MAITQFVKDTKTELKHVTWPSKKQVIQATALVIGISLAVSLILGLFDWIFGLGLKMII